MQCMIWNSYLVCAQHNLCQFSIFGDSHQFSYFSSSFQCDIVMQILLDFLEHMVGMGPATLPFSINWATSMCHFSQQQRCERQFGEGHRGILGRVLCALDQAVVRGFLHLSTGYLPKQFVQCLIVFRMCLADSHHLRPPAKAHAQINPWVLPRSVTSSKR